MDGSTLPRLFPSSGDRVQLSGDGSRLLLGSSGVLANTDGSGMVQLAITTPSSGQLQLLLYDGMFHATMNSSASRFVYLFDRPLQLATLEVNPDSLGDAPSIANPTIDPPFVLTMGRSAAMVSATVSASNPLIRVGNTVLLNGLDDPNVFHQIMLDTAGDGFFTNNNVSTNCCAVVGPRTVRVQSGVRGSDNQLHATAVEFAPFAVVDQAP